MLNVAREIRTVPVVLSVVTVPRWRPLLYARLSFSQKQLPLLPNRPLKVLQALLRPDFSNNGNAERLSWMSFEGIKTLRSIRLCLRRRDGYTSAWRTGRIMTYTAVNWFYLLESDLLAYNNWHKTILKSYWEIAIFISFIKAVVISKNQATYRCCFVVAVYYVLYYLYCGAQRSEIYLKIVYLQLRLQLFIIIKKENLAMTMLLQTKMAIQHW